MVYSAGTDSVIRAWNLEELRKGTRLVIKGHTDAVSTTRMHQVTQGRKAQEGHTDADVCGCPQRKSLCLVGFLLVFAEQDDHRDAVCSPRA